MVRWCCISHAEQTKCEQWALSVKSDPLVCVRAASMRDCIHKIKVSPEEERLGGSLQSDPALLFTQRDEVDAVSLDATHSFLAGKCGLVPVVTEYYGKTPSDPLKLESSCVSVNVVFAGRTRVPADGSAPSQTDGKETPSGSVYLSPMG